MALIYLEGFEGYAGFGDMLIANGNACKWIEFNANGNTFAISSTPYRTTQVTAGSSRSLHMGSNYMRNQLGIPSVTEVVVGIGFYMTTTIPYFSLLNIGGSVVDGKGISIGMSNSRNIFVATSHTNWGSPNTWLGSNATVVSMNTWHYIEVRTKLGTTTGECEIILNGVPWLNLTNINTATGGITSFQTVGVGCAYGTWHDTYYDDMYVCDTTGTVNNTFLGPISVYTLLPSAAGSTTQLTATGAATNWQAVSETSNNNATSYVSTSVTGQRDFYQFQALPAAVTSVQGVMIKSRSTLPTAGTRKLKLNLKNGASMISSALKALVLGSWAEDSFTSDTAPDGTAWDPTKVNATEGGIEAG